VDAGSVPGLVQFAVQVPGLYSQIVNRRLR
jgi:hypothetical protein